MLSIPHGLPRQLSGQESACQCKSGGGLVAKSCPTLAIPWTVACQAPLSMEFSRQEYWSGLPLPSLRDLPDPDIEPGLWHCRQILYCLSHQGSPRYQHLIHVIILEGRAFCSHFTDEETEAKR